MLLPPAPSPHPSFLALSGGTASQRDTKGGVASNPQRHSGTLWSSTHVVCPFLLLVPQSVAGDDKIAVGDDGSGLQEISVIDLIPANETLLKEQVSNCSLPIPLE